MKKWAVLISAVGLAFSVSGCSSDYVMATKDGRMILTDGKPTVDDDTGLISYEDQQSFEKSRDIPGPAGFTHRPSSSPGFFDFLLPLFPTLCHVDTPLSGNA